MNIEEIKSILLAVPAIAAWPAMTDIVRAGRKTSSSIPCWEYPLLACRAVGGRDEQALPAMAATACLLNSIHLVDDLLDEDPKGQHHRIGVGNAANIAVAFQAVAYRVLEKADLSPPRLAAAQNAVTRACLGTACGQNMDASPLEGDPEEAYWRVTSSKTPPLFGTAFFLGALLGGSSVETAQGVEALAGPIGKVIQVGDDMTDALETPAKPDWNTRWNNLAILYALEAEHEEQAKFKELIERIEEPEALDEAQEVLVRCGAISYGTYQVIQGYQEGKSDLDALGLPHPNELERLLESLIEPARDLFRRLGIEVPPELHQGK